MSAGRPLPGDLTDFYKLAVEMADRVSVRRGLANSFFLTVHTAVVGVLAARDVRWYLAVAGILLALVWWILLRNYRDLNRAKFAVILAVEERLPVQLYRDEWSRLLGKSRDAGGDAKAAAARFASLRELGTVERLVPVVFAMIYAAEIVRQVWP